MTAANRMSFDIIIPGSVTDIKLLKPYIMTYMLEVPYYAKHGEGMTELKITNFEKFETNSTYGDMYKATVTVDLTSQGTATDLVIANATFDWNYQGPIFYDNVVFYNVVNPPVDDPSSVDDFETYLGNVDDLKAVFIPQGDAFKLSFVNHGTGKALQFDYTIDASGYSGIVKSMNGVDWSTHDGISLWYTPDGSNQKMVVQINASGICYEAYPSLAGTEAQTLNLKFSEFTPAPWESTEHKAISLSESLGKIVAVGIYVNAVDSYAGSVKLLIDDIKATGNVVVSKSVKYDFETDTKGWVAKYDYSTLLDTSLSSDWSTNGTNSLKSAFTLTDPGEGNRSKYVFMLQKQADFTGLTKFSADIKAVTDTGSFGAVVGAKIFVQAGSDWSVWKDGGEVTIVNGTPTTLSLDLTTVKSIDTVQAIGVEFFVGSGCSGDAALYVDNVIVE